MDIKTEIEKKKIEGEILILDKGIDSKRTNEPEFWICCLITFFPFRYL